MLPYCNIFARPEPVRRGQFRNPTLRHSIPHSETTSTISLLISNSQWPWSVHYVSQIDGTHQVLTLCAIRLASLQFSSVEKNLRSNMKLHPKFVHFHVTHKNLILSRDSEEVCKGKWFTIGREWFIKSIGIPVLQTFTNLQCAIPWDDIQLDATLQFWRRILNSWRLHISHMVRGFSLPSAHKETSP